MKILFVGGTGFISTSVSRLAVALGFDLYHLNRGTRNVVIPGVHRLTADVNIPEQAGAALGDLQFDAVVDWVAYIPAHIERDLALLRGRTKQYIFISSASAYQKPANHHVIRESTPLHNPYWQYSRDKIACEERLTRACREEDFPATIVRPSLTYGEANFPVAMGGWGCYTLADRMRQGKPIIVHGDGSSLWVTTHAEDFARGFLGLVGNPLAVGDVFHITTDEVLTWNQIYEAMADALGVKTRMVHIASETLVKISPALTGPLLGDKSWSVVFDNSKIKEFVPGFQAVIPFREGIRRTVAWFDADPARRRVDAAANAELDRILSAYQGLA
jgi:nucleoside-diphosphate-sugar epimerase